MVTNPKHDQIDFTRLVDRLKKNVLAEDWQNDQERLPADIRAQKALQILRYGRKLFNDIRQEILTSGGPDARIPSVILEDIGVLDTLEPMLEEILEKVKVTYEKPPSFLAMLNPQPKPEPPPELPKAEPTSEEAAPEANEEEVPSASTSALETPPEPSLNPEVAARDLLLTSPPEEYVPFQHTPSQVPVRRRILSSKPSSDSAPDFLASSIATQEELSNQLAQMAKQLKSNAHHFAGSIAADKAVMEGTESQLEKNVDKMGSTQTQVKALRSNTRGTTWLVMLSVIIVAATFFVMILVLRVT